MSIIEHFDQMRLELKEIQLRAALWGAALALLLGLAAGYTAGKAIHAPQEEVCQESP